MLITTLTQKGQATIPAPIRKKLKLKTGDRIEFKINDDNVVLLSRAEEKNIDEIRLVSQAFKEEWGSEADKGYDNL